MGVDFFLRQTFEGQYWFVLLSVRPVAMQRNFVEDMRDELEARLRRICLGWRRMVNKLVLILEYRWNFSNSSWLLQHSGMKARYLK